MEDTSLPTLLNFHSYDNEECMMIIDYCEEMACEYEGRVRIVLADTAMFED